MIFHSDYQLCSQYKDGKEGLVSLAYSELDARQIAKGRMPDLSDDPNFVGFVLRYWVRCTQGGYWKAIPSWNPREKKGGRRVTLDELAA